MVLELSAGAIFAIGAVAGVFATALALVIGAIICSKKK